MKRLDDDDIDRRLKQSVEFAETGFDRNSLRSIAITNIIIVELLTRIVEK